MRVRVCCVLAALAAAAAVCGVRAEVQKTLTVNGDVRTYAVYNPNVGAGAAILFYLHGYGGSCLGQWEGGVLAQAVASLKVPVLVVSLCGLQNSWFHSSDNDFIVKLPPVLANDYKADATKVFVTGFSQGAVFAEVYACAFPTTVLAAGSVAGGSGSLGNPLCTGIAKPLSLVKVQGLGDSMTLDQAYPDYNAWFKTLQCNATSDQNSNHRTADCVQNTHIEFTLVPNAGHGFIEGNGFSTAQNWLAFFKKYYLSGNPPPPPSPSSTGVTPPPVSSTGPAPTTICATAAEGRQATLSCPAATAITAITFASYGLPSGTCPSFSTGSCHAPSSASAVARLCVGQRSCVVAASNDVFGDPCSGRGKTLDITALCS